MAAKAELKTKETEASVTAFLETISDDIKKADSKQIVKLMQEVTGSEPKMWGASIVGFGQKYLKYASGRELDWFTIGFSPRKQTLTLYVITRPISEFGDLFSKLGKHSVSKGCLYINKLSDVDIGVLKKIIKKSAES